MELLPSRRVTGFSCPHQGSGEAEDGEEGTSRGEGGVFADSGLLPHLHIGSSDVIREGLRDDGLPLLTQSDVAPEGSVQNGVNTSCQVLKGLTGNM